MEGTPVRAFQCLCVNFTVKNRKYMNETSPCYKKEIFFNVKLNNWVKA